MRDRPESGSDPLSEVLRLVEVRGTLTGTVTLGGAWTTSTPVTDPLKFVAVARGGVRVQTDGVTAVRATQGDVVVLNHRRHITLSNGPDGVVPERFELSETERVVRIGAQDQDVILGGHIDVNEVGRQVLRTALPPVLHIRAGAADAPHLHMITARIFEEATAGRLGGDFAVNQLTQLLVLMMLRTYLDGTDTVPPGLLRVLADHQLRPAAAAMHNNPGRPWSLKELARIAAMSRTSFAERFTASAGVPPMTYLSTWRMLLAQRALRDGRVRVGELAYDLGYASESAFSTAFKRAVGMSPLHYRRSVS